MLRAPRPCWRRSWALINPQALSTTHQPTPHPSEATLPIVTSVSAGQPSDTKKSQHGQDFPGCPGLLVPARPAASPAPGPAAPGVPSLPATWQGNGFFFGGERPDTRLPLPLKSSWCNKIGIVSKMRCRLPEQACVTKFSSGACGWPPPGAWSRAPEGGSKWHSRWPVQMKMSASVTGRTNIVPCAFFLTQRQLCQAGGGGGKEAVLSGCRGDRYISEGRGQLLCACWDFSSRWRYQNGVVHPTRTLSKTKKKKKKNSGNSSNRNFQEGG